MGLEELASALFVLRLHTFMCPGVGSGHTHQSQTWSRQPPDRPIFRVLQGVQESHCSLLLSTDPAPISKTGKFPGSQVGCMNLQDGATKALPRIP